MSVYSKTLQGVYRNSNNPLPKVNFRKYLSNKKEPSETVSGLSSAAIDKRAGMIDETYSQKRILRRLAMRLRRGGKA